MDWCKKSWRPENSANLQMLICRRCCAWSIPQRSSISWDCGRGQYEVWWRLTKLSFCSCLGGQSSLLASHSDSFVILHVSLEPTSVAVPPGTKGLKVHMMDTLQKPRLLPSQRLGLLERNDWETIIRQWALFPVAWVGSLLPWMSLSLNREKETPACPSHLSPMHMVRVCEMLCVNHLQGQMKVQSPGNCYSWNKYGSALGTVLGICVTAKQGAVCKEINWEIPGLFLLRWSGTKNERACRNQGRSKGRKWHVKHLKLCKSS